MITQLNFAQVWQGLKHAGYWFFAAIALWAFLYIFNTASWYLIIKGVCQQPATSDKQPMVNPRHPVGLAWLYKITVSGFALNYATPGGLMGGEPYRIMELAPQIGTERASSSVILYAMTHIFSHFWFWFLSIFLFVFTQTVTPLLAVLLTIIGLFCLSGIWFFISGYRKGLANRIMNVLRYIPVVKRWARPFVEKHREQLNTIDSQISALHKQNPRFFVSSVMPHHFSPRNILHSFGSYAPCKLFYMYSYTGFHLPFCQFAVFYPPSAGWTRRRFLALYNSPGTNCQRRDFRCTHCSSARTGMDRYRPAAYQDSKAP